MRYTVNTDAGECPSCGAAFQGKYCRNCGEKVFHPSDLGLKKFTSQTVDIFTHFDSKFLRSLKYLMLKPGFLVKAYITGNRVKYAKPMQVFVLANVLFYFVTHILGITDYSPNFGDHYYFGLSGYWIFQWTEGFDNYIASAIDQLGAWKQHQLHLSDKQFYYTFFENSWIYSKTFIILLIPLFSVATWVAYIRRFKYFGEAVIFVVYFLSFQLITFCVITLILNGFNVNIYQPFNWLFFKTPVYHVTNIFFNNSFEFQNLLLWFPYLYFAIQRVYKGHPLLTVIITFLLSKVLFFLTFGVYKKLLIVLTILLMHHV
ncbi:DUF3667 domain-containing protein [Mucilaginibacter limnophilus]|uniref:DUF3667 domain-containing protein n=1 Tax=Mucilaginibacter limnophilus TaxID=1932778 RepID=A0A3S2V9G1_9SPHI|nr:DUF3667 domain-containing protein [Mucilaginibacter limnophilus]RVU01957.1 DUF3667 domain-containing protein [Mucilaginibacter limnophilus]